MLNHEKTKTLLFEYDFNPYEGTEELWISNDKRYIVILNKINVSVLKQFCKNDYVVMEDSISLSKLGKLLKQLR